MSVRGVGIRLLLALPLALMVGGCETFSVTPADDQGSTRSYTTIVIGDITPRHPEWKRFVRFYKEGLAQRLRESRAFDRVLYPAPVTLPADAIVVQGAIDTIDEGSELLRILISDSASRATVEGQFRLVDGSERLLAEFRQERVSDDSDIADDQIYMEDLVGQFGRDTAGVVIQWSRGNDLESERAVVEWWDETMDAVH